MLYTKAEFAAATGLSSGNLSNYIHKLKKVVASGDYIDDEIPQNAAFLERRKHKKQSDRISNNKKINEASKKKMTSEAISERISLEALYDELNLASPEQLYNHEAEKQAVEIMIQANQKGLTYIMVPVEFAFNNYSWGMVKAYEFLLNREISILQKLGVDIDQEEIDSLITYYSNLCKASVLSIKADTDTIMKEIIEEYETKPNIDQ
jgi:hypothetical protein